MSTQYLYISRKVKKFKKSLKVDGDKSISIRWLLLASQAIGISKAKNLLRSEDVLSAVQCLKKLGVRINFANNNCTIYGRGINGFKYKKNIILNAGNSGTVGRLILPLLIKSPYKIKIIGDKSLSKRDFSRVINPLNQIGAQFYPNTIFTHADSQLSLTELRVTRPPGCDINDTELVTMTMSGIEHWTTCTGAMTVAVPFLPDRCMPSWASGCTPLWQQPSEEGLRSVMGILGSG